MGSGLSNHDGTANVGEAVESRFPPALFLGFAVASIGGPLALLSIFPGVAGDGIESAGLVVALAVVVFAAPLTIWLVFSRTVVSPGGLSAFVGSAAGRPAALVHGWIWAFAYFLYLPYTITFVVYDLLTPVFPGITPYRGALELILPVVLIAVAFAPLPILLAGVGVIAAVQLVLLAVMAGVGFANTGPVRLTGADGADTGRAVGATALLFICASLPLYLGAEVRGGSRTVRRGLATAVGVVGALFLVAAIPLAEVPDVLLNAPVPGAAIAQAYSGRPLAVAVGLATAASVLVLILAEYLALARLVHWLHGPPVRKVLAWIALPFLAGDAISLIDPDRFYDDLLKPSLGALFVSQLIVFLVFLRVRRDAAAIGLVAVSSALVCYGLYTLLTGAAST
jgi:amino acid transporter